MRLFDGRHVAAALDQFQIGVRKEIPKLQAPGGRKHAVFDTPEDQRSRSEGWQDLANGVGSHHLARHARHRPARFFMRESPDHRIDKFLRDLGRIEKNA